MSAVPSAQTKGVKSSKKYQSLNVNELFKGKSSESSPATVIQKHGLQSLGKVASARRIPPPALLPSLRAENSGNDPTVSLVPSGGQGWGSNNNSGSPSSDNSQTTPATNNTPLDNTFKKLEIGSKESPMHSDVSEESKATVNGVLKSASGILSSSTSVNNNPLQLQNNFGSSSQETTPKLNHFTHVPLLSSNVKLAAPILAPCGGVPPAQVSKRITTSPGLAGPVSSSRVSPPTEDKSKGGDRRTGGNTGSGEGGGGGSGAPPPGNTPQATTKGWNIAPKVGAPKSSTVTHTQSSGPPTLASVIAGNQQPAPFSQKEFPKLGTSGTGGGANSTNGTSETSLRFLPGPSLRPQTGGDFGPNRTSGQHILPQQSFAEPPPKTEEPVLNPVNSKTSSSATTSKLPAFRGIMPDYMGGNDVDNFPAFPTYRSQNSSQASRNVQSNYNNRKSDRDHHNTNPPSTEPECLPLPIIKKEELEQLHEVSVPFSESWAASSSEIDFNKKLDFSEDESTNDDHHSSSRSQRHNDKWNKKKENASANTTRSTQLERPLASPMDTTRSFDDPPAKQPEASASFSSKGGARAGGRQYRWSESSDKNSQPLLNHPPPLLPCPPQTTRQPSYPPREGSSEVVVQQALNKATIREKEEQKRYEEKISSQNYDDKKKTEEPESDGPYEEERGAAPLMQSNRGGMGGRDFSHRDAGYGNRGGYRDIRNTNLPPRLQKQQQQYQQQQHSASYRSTNTPPTMFEPKFGAGHSNRTFGNSRETESSGKGYSAPRNTPPSDSSEGKNRESSSRPPLLSSPSAVDTKAVERTRKASDSATSTGSSGHYRMDWAAESEVKRNEEMTDEWGSFSKGKDWNDISPNYQYDRRTNYDHKEHGGDNRRAFDKRTNYGTHDNVEHNDVDEAKQWKNYDRRGYEYEKTSANEGRSSGSHYTRKGNETSNFNSMTEETKNKPHSRPPLLEDPPYKTRNNMYDRSHDSFKEQSYNKNEDMVIESWADASPCDSKFGVDYSPECTSKPVSVVPQPITVDRLEPYCEKELEIRKNMTTLKKGAIINSSASEKKSESVSNNENKQTKENKQANSNAKDKSNVWNSSNSNGKSSKNGERARAETSKGSSESSDSTSTSTKATSWAEKISGQQPAADLTTGKDRKGAPGAKRQSPLLETPTAEKPMPTVLSTTSKEQKENISTEEKREEDGEAKGKGGRGRRNESSSRGGYAPPAKSTRGAPTSQSGSGNYANHRGTGRGNSTKYTEYSNRNRNNGGPRLNKNNYDHDNYYYDSGYGNNYYHQNNYRNKGKKDDWIDSKEEGSGEAANYRGGKGASRGGRNTSNKAPLKGTSPVPLSNVVVSAPLMGLELYPVGTEEGTSRPKERYNQNLPPRLQQKRIEERGGRGAGRRGGVSSRGGRSGKSKEEGGEEGDWECDSHHSADHSDRGHAADSNDYKKSNQTGDVEGFLEVSRRKKEKSTRPNEETEANKRAAKEKKPVANANSKAHPTSSSYDRNRTTNKQLPPRLAKQRENKIECNASQPPSSTVETFHKNSNVSSQAVTSNTTTSTSPPAVAPPIKNAWEKPLTAALRSNSPAQSNETKENNVPEKIQKEEPAPLFTSDCNAKIISSKDDKSSLDGSSVPNKTIIFENTNFKAAHAAAASSVDFMGANKHSSYDGAKQQRAPRVDRRFYNNQHNPTIEDLGVHSSTNSSNNIDVMKTNSKQDKPDPIELPIAYSKPEESTDMKLEFTFDAQVDHKGGVSKALNLNRALALNTSGGLTPNSPSTEDLNKKIASVRMMWDVDTPLPSVSEQASEDINATVSSNFSANFSTSKNNGTVANCQTHSPVVEASLYSSVPPPSHSIPSRDTPSSAGSVVTGVPPPSQMAPPSSVDMAQSVYHNSVCSNVVPMVEMSNNVYTNNSSNASSYIKTDVNRSAGGNVCKVKPQQQSNVCSGAELHSIGISAVASQMAAIGGTITPPQGASVGGNHSTNNIYQTLGGTAAFGGIGGAIPSPPIMYNTASQQVQQTANLYQPFVEQRNAAASQFSQFAHYGLGQGLGNNAFGQQSMFLQTPPLTASTDMYSNNLSQYRIQPAVPAGFGQTAQPPPPQNQNTVLISSANSTLMSSAVKPSTQTFGGTNQQSFGSIGTKATAGTPFQQSGLGNALQQGPTTPLYIYEPVQPIGLLGSQLMQRPTVQGSVLQTIQTPNSFYSNNGAGAGASGGSAPNANQQATGFFPAGSALQQSQPTLQTPSAAYGLQGFANQQHLSFNANLNLAAQQLAVATQNYRPGNNNANALPATFQKSLQPGGGVSNSSLSGIGAVQDNSRQQMKSPNSMQSNSFGAVSSIYFSGGQTKTGAMGTSQQAAGLQQTTGGLNGSGGARLTTANYQQHLSAVSNVGMLQNSQQQHPQFPSGLRGGNSPSVPTSVMATATNMLRNGTGTVQQQQQIASMNTMTQSRYPGGPPGPIQRPLPNAGHTVQRVVRNAHSTIVTGSAADSNSLLPSASSGSSSVSQREAVASSANPSTAQQAQLRAEALSSTQAFFGKNGGLKGEKKDDSLPPEGDMESTTDISPAPSSDSK